MNRAEMTELLELIAAFGAQQGVSLQNWRRHDPRSLLPNPRRAAAAGDA